MNQHNLPWLSGAMFGNTSMRGKNCMLMLEIFGSIDQHSDLALRFFDERREQSILEFEERVQTVATVRLPSSKRYQRGRELFETRLFSQCRFEVEIPCDILRRWRYLTLTIGRDDKPMPSRAIVNVNARKRAINSIYLEVHKRKMFRNGCDLEAMFLLITRRQASKRMEKIIQEEQALLAQDEATIDALSNMMFRMFQGGDSPLLTEEIQ